MPEIELERYELFEAPTYRFEPERNGFELERRDFFRFLGGGLVLLLALGSTSVRMIQGKSRFSLCINCIAN